VSDTYQFALDRKRGLALAGCFIAAALLLFFAGTITGMLLSSSRISALRAENKPPEVKPALPKEPELPKPSPPAPTAMPASSPTPPEASSATAASTSAAQPGQTNLVVNPLSTQPSVADKGSLVGPDATTNLTAAKTNPATISPTGAGNSQTTAAATQPSTHSQAPQPSNNAVASHPVQTSLAVPLAVRVGSFTVKSNADALVASLSDLGYRPVMSEFTDTHGRVWYSVKLGPYTRWNAASAVAARVSIAENVKPIIGPMS
jgi:SPOR domain